MQNIDSLVSKLLLRYNKQKQAGRHDRPSLI